MKFKKPKFWDLKKPNFFSYLLLPFTIPLLINNFLLDKKNKKKRDKIKTICVGNIYIGGTGKTPTTIKLYEILNKLEFNTSIGKKIYSSHYDEKMLLEKKANLISAKSRKKILDIAVQNNLDCLIFDDGLQDKNLSYNLQIVCFDSCDWIGNGKLIPSGPLREKILSLKKYDAVFLKNTVLVDSNIIDIIKKINPKIKIFETKYRILNLNKFNLSDKYLVFSGIGSPTNFNKTLIKEGFNIVEEINFPDHFDYKKKDIDFIKNRASKLGAKIITTEKDFIKISDDINESIDFLEVNLEIKNEIDLINFLKLKLYE